MTVDFADWGDSADRALKIYNQTVPLGRKPVGVNADNNAVAAGGSVTIVNAATISQPSFHMLIGLEWPSAAPTIPFGMLKFQWTDSASGFTVDPDWVVMPGGVLALDFCYVCGPARADTLTVTLVNLDPAIGLLYSFGISQSSHVYERLRLEQVGNPTVPVFTRAAQNNQMGIIGSVAASIAGGGTNDRLCSAWAGPATLNVDNAGGNAAVLVRILDPGVIAGGAALYGTANTGIIVSVLVNVTNPQTLQLYLPNGPVVIRQINQSMAATIQPTVTLTRLEQ